MNDEGERKLEERKKKRRLARKEGVMRGRKEKRRSGVQKKGPDENSSHRSELDGRFGEGRAVAHSCLSLSVINQC